MSLNELREKYRQWWVGKLCRTNKAELFKLVVDIKVWGNASGWNAVAELVYEDGTTSSIDFGDSFRPRKKDVEVSNGTE